MDEAKRIIRFILPGMVFVILILATLAILNIQAVIEIFSSIGEASFGALLTLLVFSGGLGYVFSIIFFGTLWLIGEKNKWHIYNFRDPIKRLIASNKLQVFKINELGEEVIFEIKSKRDGLYIMNALWHGESAESQNIEAVSKKFDSYLSDIATGLGTALTGTLFSFFTSLFLFFEYNSNFSQIFLCVLIHGIFFYLVFLSHKRTYKMYQTIANTTFATEISRKYEKEEKPIKIIFSE